MRGRKMKIKFLLTKLIDSNGNKIFKRTHLYPLLFIKSDSSEKGSEKEEKEGIKEISNK